jgi:hypothetical protein
VGQVGQRYQEYLECPTLQGNQPVPRGLLNLSHQWALVVLGFLVFH